MQTEATIEVTTFLMRLISTEPRIREYVRKDHCCFDMKYMYWKATTGRIVPTRNKKLLGAPRLSTRSKDATY